VCLEKVGSSRHKTAEKLKKRQTEDPMMMEMMMLLLLNPNLNLLANKAQTAAKVNLGHKVEHTHVAIGRTIAVFFA